MLPLRRFIKIFPGNYYINSDTQSIDVDDGLTMIGIWDKFSHEEREELCRYLGETRKYKNMHQGLLSLLQIVDVISALCERPSFSDMVKTTLRNRTGQLASSMNKNNALLHRLTKDKTT